MPFASLFLDATWAILGGAMLVAVGAAILRLIPRSEAELDDVR